MNDILTEKKILMNDIFTEEEKEVLQKIADKFAEADTPKEQEILTKRCAEIGQIISKRIKCDIKVDVKVTKTTEYLTEILKLIEKKKDIVIGEVGACEGVSTEIIAKWIKGNRTGKLIVVEWFKGSQGIIPSDDDGFIKEAFLEKMKPYEDIYTLMHMSSEEAASKLPDNHFDWFWIDADHRYSCVKKDIELWYPKVKVGGILAGHDYNSETYDERYIEQDTFNEIHHGVTKAVNERFGIPEHKREFWWIRKK